MLRCSPWMFLPPVFSVFTAAGLWQTYFVALYYGTVTPLGSTYNRTAESIYPPYISVSGNFPPASCIFSEVMNLAAFMGFIIAVLRYLQLKQHRLDKQWLNVSSLVVFSIACFGMTLVGNFQVFNEEDIHNLGTFLTFGLGTVYCWLQSVITLRANIKNEGKISAAIRFLLSGCVTLCMILFFSLMPQRLHVPATQVQWSLVMFFLLFIASFAIEFRHDRFLAVCSDYDSGSLRQSHAFPEVSMYMPDPL